jgi:hypothetical protein
MKYGAAVSATALLLVLSLSGPAAAQAAEDLAGLAGRVQPGATVWIPDGYRYPRS